MAPKDVEAVLGAIKALEDQVKSYRDSNRIYEKHLLIEHAETNLRVSRALQWIVLNDPVVLGLIDQVRELQTEIAVLKGERGDPVPV